MLFVAVFDTNVLFSAIGWRGAPYQCLELARSGQVRGLTCREILDELAGILARKLRFSDEQVADSLTDFLPALGVADTQRNSVCEHRTIPAAAREEAASTRGGNRL